MEGRIFSWFQERGYGFIKPEGSNNFVFCHHSALRQNPKSIEAHMQCTFELGHYQGRVVAVNVCINHRLAT